MNNNDNLILNRCTLDLALDNFKIINSKVSSKYYF